MIIAFLESVKYVGHFFPLVILRVFMGSWFLRQALLKYNGDYLLQPKLAAAINEFLPNSDAPEWYRNFLDSVVVPHWQLFAYSLMYFEFIIGTGLILGFLTRPLAILGAFIAWNYSYNTAPDLVPFYTLQLVVCLVLSWLGAGRCLGMDYFFFKRQRGLLW